MKWGKLLHKTLEPKVLRENAGFAESFCLAEGVNPLLSKVGVFFHGAILHIGRDIRFESFPELVHAVEFGPLLGQPNQEDSQRLGQRLALGSGMTGGFIQDQPDLTSRVGLTQATEKQLEALLP